MMTTGSRCLGLLLSLVCSRSALACNLAPESDWFLPIASIYARTDQVFVGKMIDMHDLCKTDGPVAPAQMDPKKWFEAKERDGCFLYSFTVLKALKGTYRKGDIVQVRGLLDGRAKEGISYNRSCRILVGFNRLESYVIFRDAFHPRAYRRVESIHSPWVKQVESLR